MVASTIFLGKSSAATSPGTPIASPPIDLISSTTVFTFVASILVSFLSDLGLDTVT